jgi:hypothetical protein
VLIALGRRPQLALAADADPTTTENR